MEDIVGARMKHFEKQFTEERIDHAEPVYVRLDGRGFSKFTRGLERPFDARMSECMIRTTEYLVAETKADIGFVQSDEISLGWKPKTNETAQFLFDGKIQKLASTLAASCSVRFFQPYKDAIGEPKSLPTFDCRILNIPEDEFLEMFKWRQADAQKNAINTVAHHLMGAKRILGMSNRTALNVFQTEFNIDFHRDYPEFFRSGTFVHRSTVLRNLTVEELAVIPEQHRSTGPVERTQLTRSHRIES